MKQTGAVAAGHPLTVEAATTILQAGGNAFDAAVAAHLAACVTEPVLASLGGGGYLLARTERSAEIYDFFVQTPQLTEPPQHLDFHPISADFGTTRQEFHIGAGSIAVPGVIKGLFAIQRQLGRLPMTALAEPAIDLARHGVKINGFQAYIFDVVSPIYRHCPKTFATYRSPTAPDRLVQEGDLLCQPQLADFMENMAIEGEDLFYQGDVARQITGLCQEKGGWLVDRDLTDYQVLRREPLKFRYRGIQVTTNPPPSSGGLLIAFALKLLENFDLTGTHFGDPTHLDLLVRIQQATQQARLDLDLDETHKDTNPPMLSQFIFERYLASILPHPLCRRGTTHISIMDGGGNIASLTTSNGEGCGYPIPGTGIILNNMLGEQDLNPHGFHRWPPNCRMTSMMAPTIASTPKTTLALGSGGSNRLRTAILQCLINLTDFNMALDHAINAPRLHYENDQLNLENGFPDSSVAEIARRYPKLKHWPDKNLFFGGVHAVSRNSEGFFGCGDPRRGGAAKILR